MSTSTVRSLVGSTAEICRHQELVGSRQVAQRGREHRLTVKERGEEGAESHPG
ncbi:MAG: hypothetical protein ACYDGN_17565 [Acidimicrobiales bacterium]